jgi:hypothetical protein
VSSPDVSGPDRALSECERRVEQLQAALASHAVVDQARGILMGLHRIDADAAWALLLRVSSHQNVKLRTLAEAVIAVVTSATPLEPTDATTSARRFLLPHDLDPPTPPAP